MAGTANITIAGALERTGLDKLPGQGFLALSGQQFLRLDARLPTLVSLPLNAAAQAALRDRYPADWQAALVTDRGLREGPLEDLLHDVGSASYLHLPPLPWDKDLRDFRTLVEIVAWLRAPDGCPWDRAQTHQSLTPFLLEETYEALEEIDANDLPALREELGDVLLQVALHSEIAREERSFSVDDVVEGLASKLVRRHPHVFGDVTAHSAEEVAARWEVLKSRERNGASLMQGVPNSLPALVYAQRVQGRAGNVGFDWPSTEGVLEKVHEEAQELEQTNDVREREAELGDLLFSLVNLGRHLDVDVETALRHANRRFVARFRIMETLAGDRGSDLSQLPLEEQDTLWDEAKRNLAQGEE